MKPEVQRVYIAVRDTESLPDKALIDGVEGVMDWVSDPELHNRPDGSQYTSQEFFIKDGPSRVRCVAFDHNPVTKYLGKKVLLLSNKARNGRYGGIVMHVEKTGFFKRSVQRHIRITKLGGIYEIKDN